MAKELSNNCDVLSHLCLAVTRVVWQQDYLVRREIGVTAFMRILTETWKRRAVLQMLDGQVATITHQPLHQSLAIGVLNREIVVDVGAIVLEWRNDQLLNVLEPFVVDLRVSDPDSRIAL